MRKPTFRTWMTQGAIGALLLLLIGQVIAGPAMPVNIVNPSGAPVVIKSATSLLEQIGTTWWAGQATIQNVGAKTVRIVRFQVVFLTAFNESLRSVLISADGQVFYAPGTTWEQVRMGGSQQGASTLPAGQQAVTFLPVEFPPEATRATRLTVERVMLDDGSVWPRR